MDMKLAELFNYCRTHLVLIGEFELLVFSDTSGSITTWKWDSKDYATDFKEIEFNNFHEALRKVKEYVESNR